MYAKIDKRLELIGILEVLAGFDHFLTQNYDNYFNDIKIFFNRFKNHETVNWFRDKSIENYFGNSYALSIDEDFTKFIGTDEAKRETCEEAIEYLQKFIKDTNFDYFYDNHREFYKSIINDNRINNDFSYSKFLGDYYKKEFPTPIIYLKILQADFGEVVTSFKDTNMVYNVIVGSSHDKHFITESSIDSLLFHECTHPIVGKYLQNKTDFFCKTENLMKNILTNDFISMYYPFYNIFIDESITRVLTTILINKKRDNEDLEFLLKEQEEFGFIYQLDFYKILKEYDGKMELERFFDKILLFLEKESVRLNMEKNDELLKIGAHN